MSTRDVPRELADRVAALEARIRQLDSENAQGLRDVRSLILQPGDLLIGSGERSLVRLGGPPSIPTGPGQVLLRWNPANPLRLEWDFVPS